MRTLNVVLLLAFSFVTSSSAIAASAARATDFKWMSGCWGYESGGSSYEEHWLAPSGNSILGIAHRDADGFTRDFDYLRIISSGDGFDFVSQPRGGEELRYGMTAHKANSATFESLGTAPFPKRITYEFVAPNALNVRMDGSGENGASMSNVFPMRRKACAGN